MDNMKWEDWGSVGEKRWETINTAHQDAASINWGQSNQNNNINNKKQ